MSPPPAHPLPGADALSRALRPLARPIRSRRARVLDEDATAARAAGDGRWLPVLRPAAQPRWEAVVVVDDHISMAIWERRARAFAALLHRQGAFGGVRVRWLNTDTKDPAEVVLRGPDLGGLPPVPAGLPEVARQRVAFVLTDGAGPAWQAGIVLPVLREWARRLPVVIIHLLPQPQWHRTGVSPRQAQLRAPSAGCANERLAWRLRDPVAMVGEQAVPIPVLELRPHWLAAWVRLVSRDRPGWVALPAVLAAPPPLPVRPSAAVPVVGDPRQWVREFVSRATPIALELATCLAAVPLSPAVVRVVARGLLPGSDTSHLAEVLNSGLLHPVVGDRGAPPVTFEFAPGVREELLATGRRRDTVRVWRVVAAQLGAAFPALARLGQVLNDPDAAPVPALTAATAPLLRVERIVLRALSGRYLSRWKILDDLLTEAETTEPAQQSVTIATLKTIYSRVHPGSGGAGVSSSTTPAATGAAPATSPAAPTTSTASGAPPAPAGPPAEAPLAQAEPAPPAQAAQGVAAVPGAPAPPGEPMRPPVRTPAIWGNIPPRNPNFTGRTKLLAQLHEQIQGGTTAVLPHALHGMGGVGKSHLAIQYVYLHQNEYDLIWWIPAERTAQIGTAMVELAHRMNLPAGPDVGSARTAVLEALRLGTPFANWLLIFDNAESPESLRPFVPTGGPGSIMITSRNPQWGSVARTLEVDVFTREESIQLLRRRGPELDDEAADRLAEALGDLPLALEQAAAWRAETGMSADEYLRLFAETEQRVELLAQTTPMDYQLPVAAAWNVSLDQLVLSNPAAFRLLQLCSFLAPDPIPRTLLGGAHNVDVHVELNAALRDPMHLNRAIRDITRYALARINYRTNSIQMHRLIQSVLKDRMTEQEQRSMRASAHQLLASGDRNDPDTPANWPNYAELYPHLDASGAVHSTEPRVQQLVENEAKFLYWSGDYETSLELSQRAYASWHDQLGPEAPATLSIGHRVGFMLYTLGRYREAAEHNRQILAAYERTTEEDTEELLQQIGAVAADLRVAGEFAEALRMDEDLHQRHLRLLGPEDPKTLNAAHNLAVSLRLAGDLRRAHDVDQETYDHRVLLFGEDHAHTLESHLNLVIDRRELGEYLAARNEMQEIVDRLPQVWGSEQTQTLRARRRLASAVRKAGDHEGARAISEEIRAGFASQYGEDNPDALLAALGLAVDLRATDHFEEAAELGEQVRDRYQDLFDDQHPYTVAAALNTAITYRLRDEVARARQTNEEGLATLTRRLGADHPLALAAAVNLANDLYAQDEFQAAYERDADTAERMRRVLGDEHPSTLICLGNLAMDLLALDRQSEGYELHADVVARLQRVLGDRHPATVAGTDLTVRGDCDLDPMPL